MATTMGREEYTHEDMTGLEAELQEHIYNANRVNDNLTAELDAANKRVERLEKHIKLLRVKMSDAQDCLCNQCGVSYRLISEALTDAELATDIDRVDKETNNEK